jgi:hypothetical protein
MAKGDGRMSDIKYSTIGTKQVYHDESWGDDQIAFVDDRDNAVYFSPGEALLLLDWLTQNKADLMELAKR